jgi:hypothetical protein
VIVTSIFIIRTRGTVATVTLDGPVTGSTLRRSDGAEWTIRGVEWWAIPRRPGKGDVVGLLLGDGVEICVGDDVAIHG